MAENALTGGSVASPAYPTFQPIQQQNPLAQVQAAQGLALQQQALQQQQFQIGKQRLDYLHDQMGSLAAKPDVSFQDVTNVATNLVRMGYPPDQVSQELANAPKDAAGIKAWATQHMAGIANHAQRLEMGYGSPIAINTGGSTQFGAASPMRPGQPQFAGGTNLPNTPTVGLTEGPPTRDRTGAVVPTRVTNEQAQGLATGKYKMGPNGEIIPTAGAPVGQAIAGAPAGATEAAGVAAAGSAGQANSLEASAGGAPIRRGMLNNLEDDLAKFSTGPLAQATLQGKRLYNQAAGAVGMPQVDAAGVAAHENFNKQATQLAQQQFSALGGTGTDQQLGSAFKANPNDALSNMGNKQIIQMLKGNEDAIAAKNTAWQDWKKKNGADTYGQFQEDWNQNFSPRAFQWVHMSKSERDDLYKNMKPGEREQLGNALDIAEKRKWISRSQAQ